MSITFGTLALPSFWKNETTLLVESLRAFGGELADAQVLAFTLKDHPLLPEDEEKLRSAGIEIIQFDVSEGAREFPLAVVPHGAAAAERTVNTDLLVWALPDTLILNSPLEFTLPAGKHLAYRPVHHRNIGAAYDHALDAFWQLIYTHCSVPAERVFKMKTCYRESIRPYFNAGLLVCRPAEGLMRNWLDVFERTYKHPDFTPFYTDRKYAIFMHQAVLSGVILNQYTPDQMAALPESYNYPLHMHQDYPAAGRVQQIGDLTTARFEDIKTLAEVLALFETNDNQKEWLTHMTAQIEGSQHG